MCVRMHLCVIVHVWCFCSLHWIWCVPFITVASQGPCESDNLIVISGTGAIPVPSLQQPLCFGCFFFSFQGFSFFNPLGTEWSVTDSGVTTSLTNDTTLGEVTLSGINGSLLLQSPSSLLQFGTSFLRCAYTSPTNDDFSWIATFTESSKCCLISQVICTGKCPYGSQCNIVLQFIKNCINNFPNTGSRNLSWVKTFMKYWKVKFLWLKIFQFTISRCGRWPYPHASVIFAFSVAGHRSFAPAVCWI